MAEYKPIVIACPQYRKLVRGEYACGSDGRYLLGPGGEFVLERVRCGQSGGRCMATLCALHRYNRRGPGTWYPARILAAPRRKQPWPRPQAAGAGSAGATDVVC